MSKTKIKAPPVIIRNASTDHMLKIYFNDAPHLILKQKELIGFHAFEDQLKQQYGIMFFTLGQPFATRYDEYDHWRQVLTILDN